MEESALLVLLTSGEKERESRTYETLPSGIKRGATTFVDTIVRCKTRLGGWRVRGKT